MIFVIIVSEVEVGSARKHSLIVPRVDHIIIGPASSVTEKGARALGPVHEIRCTT